MPSVPLATYRLQFHEGFGFAEAAGLADYLADLGISHLYSPPILQAAPGSLHGYDVVDPTRVNAKLGGENGFCRLCEGLRRRNLGLVLDIVPNHLAIGSPANVWWWDVLENGPASRYASYFDVDWADTRLELPGGRWRNELTGDVHTGRTVLTRKILARFPVALLVSEG